MSALPWCWTIRSRNNHVIMDLDVVVEYDDQRHVPTRILSDRGDPLPDWLATAALEALRDQRELREAIAWAERPTPRADEADRQTDEAKGK